MVMRWEPEVQIEDLRNHPAELVMRLRTLLTRGAHTNPDPNHPGFLRNRKRLPRLLRPHFRHNREDSAPGHLAHRKRSGSSPQRSINSELQRGFAICSAGA